MNDTEKNIQLNTIKLAKEILWQLVPNAQTKRAMKKLEEQERAITQNIEQS
jgi:hypothetical protein